jgi:hypothetical protein
MPLYYQTGLETLSYELQAEVARAALQFGARGGAVGAGGRFITRMCALYIIDFVHHNFCVINNQQPASWCGTAPRRQRCLVIRRHLAGKVSKKWQTLIMLFKTSEA